MSRWDDLLAVQEQDTAIDQLTHRRRTIPARAELEAAMAEIEDLEKRAAVVEEERHGLGRSQQRLEDEIAGLQAKAAEHDKTLYSGTVSNPRELQALQDEIGALKRRVSQLEDQQLDLMEQIEPLDQRLAVLSTERSGIDEKAAAARAVIAEAEVEIDDEVQRVAASRAEQAAAVDPDLLAEYERLRNQLGGIGIARLVNGHCGGCHLGLSAVELDRIKKLPEDEAVYCEECGRLLAR